MTKESKKEGLNPKDILNNLDIISIVFIVIGIILLLVGLFTDVPSKEFSFNVIRKYVGGDAYNAIIEASVRGGIIAGAVISKAVYVTGGLILTCLGFNRVKNI